jgi:hypothetical protein
MTKRRRVIYSFSSSDEIAQPECIVCERVSGCGLNSKISKKHDRE